MQFDGTLRLLPGREKSLLRRHPWVFSGAVAGFEGSPEPGGTVLVRAADGTALGPAAFSPVSQIRARMWSFDADETVDDAFVAQRVAAAAQRRDSLMAEAGTDAARLVFSEADGLPGIVADRYADTVVCQVTSAGAERWREVVFDAIAALPGIRSVHERSDADSREREGLPMRAGTVRGEPVGAVIEAHEAGFRFAVDPQTGHKTGFYLDQRHGRRAVERWAAGRRVLNVFCYTGAFSVIAAARGAGSLLSIDSSGPALETARRSGALNSVDVGDLMEADAFRALRGLRDRARQFDLILLDPPKLAANDRQVDRASRAYKDLNLLALKLLAPGGVLMTWSCSGAVSAELFQKIVAGAAVDAGRTSRIIDRLHQPADHPVPLNFPEADYLKGLVVEVE